MPGVVSDLVCFYGWDACRHCCSSAFSIWVCFSVLLDGGWLCPSHSGGGGMSVFSLFIIRYPSWSRFPFAFVLIVGTGPGLWVAGYWACQPPVFFPAGLRWSPLLVKIRDRFRKVGLWSTNVTWSDSNVCRCLLTESALVLRWGVSCL